MEKLETIISFYLGLREVEASGGYRLLVAGLVSRDGSFHGTYECLTGRVLGPVSPLVINLNSLHIRFLFRPFECSCSVSKEQSLDCKV